MGGARMSPREQVTLAERYLAGGDFSSDFSGEGRVRLAEKLLAAAAEKGRLRPGQRDLAAVQRLWEVRHMLGVVPSATMPPCRTSDAGEVVTWLDGDDSEAEKAEQASAAPPCRRKPRRKTPGSVGDGTFDGPDERRRREAQRRESLTPPPAAVVVPARRKWQTTAPEVLVARALRLLSANAPLAEQLLEDAAGRGYQPAVVKLSEIRSGAVPTSRPRKHRKKPKRAKQPRPELITVVLGAGATTGSEPEPEPQMELGPEPEPEWRREAKQVAGAPALPTAALQDVVTKIDWLTHAMLSFDQRLCQAESKLLRRGARPSTAPAVAAPAATLGTGGAVQSMAL